MRKSVRAAKALFEFAGAHFQLTQTDRKVYQALQSLESQQDGLCKKVVATHRTIHRCATVSLNTVGRVLARLSEKGLIEYTPGSKNYAEHLASTIRRRSRAELKDRMLQEQPAQRMAALLNKRPIQYGRERVQPTYRVVVTNRLYASHPNVQGSKALRASRLAAGCQEGEVLLELDFTAAEPSVIAQKLGYTKDGYQIVAEAEGMSRDHVKKIFNAIVYARGSAVMTAQRYGIQTPEALAFFTQVDELRHQLRRPNGKPARTITTATGTVITADLRRKIHKGTLLSYYAQGTIADFINRAALKIIELEQHRGWRLAIPCHDSLYVIGRPEHEQELVALILEEAERAGLSMRLRGISYSPTGEKCNPREYQKSGTPSVFKPAA